MYFNDKLKYRIFAILIFEKFQRPVLELTPNSHDS